MNNIHHTLVKLLYRIKKNKGETGTLFVIIFLISISLLAFTFIGGQLPRSKVIKSGEQVVIITNTPEEAKKNLQLYTFMGATLTPGASAYPTPNSICDPTSPSDIMLILDYSGSLAGGSLEKAKLAVLNFIDLLVTKQSNNRVGLVTFNSNAILQSGFSQELPVLKAIVSSLPGGSGSTCIKCGIETANNEFLTNGRSGVNKVAILLSDGEANRPDTGDPVQLTKDAVKQGFEQSNIKFFTTGFGGIGGSFSTQFINGNILTTPPLSGGTTAGNCSRVNESLMKDIASSTGGKYYCSPTMDDLRVILQEIGALLGCTTNQTTGGSQSPTSQSLTSAPATSAPLRDASLNPLGTPGGSNPECGIANPELRLSKDSAGKCCVMDGPVKTASDCCPGVPTCKEIMDAGGSLASDGVNYSCNMSPESTAALWCDAKPVIYLYPEVKTIVDVSLIVPGTIPVSDPLYPIDGGWKNIEAYPDGTLIYQGKTYKELFYEASISPIDPPENGFIVSRKNLHKSLMSITTKLGLNKFEQQEFLDYWVPRLTELNSPYMHISVFSPEQKEIIDHVDISPKPDTFIQFIMYFKPLQKSITLKPLILPDTPPKRIGFTAVEWGGIIDE